MVKPALMFKDKAVLQRDKEIAVWGQADPGAEVEVSIQGQTARTVTGPDGKWLVRIGPLLVSFDEEMTIRTAEDELRLRNLMVGDVWFAGGQSNMEFHMRYDADMAAEKEICANPAIRFFDYPEVSFPGQIDLADYGKNYGFWRDCDPENLERFSAVAYYCVKELQQAYKIPFGILGCNWGGTPAMSWIPEEVAAANGDRHRIEDYHRQLEALDVEEYDRKFLNNPQSFHTDLLGDPISDLMLFGCSEEEFQAKIAELMSQMGIDPAKLDPAEFMPPMGPRHEWRPAGVYESMLLPCVPYGIRGFLWYQGCSDSDTREDAEGYYKVFPALIRHWRELWGEKHLPFLFVQLAPLNRWMQTVGDFYPVTRAAQQHTADTVPDTAMAVISDVGMEWDIHPKKKQPVGHRLALLARNYVYGEKEVLCEAPTLQSVAVKDGEAVLTFANTGEGLHLAKTLPYGQEVGADKAGGLRLFQNGEEVDLADAHAEASGDKLTVSCRAIRGGVPTRAEMAQTGWYLVNLYNSADIPARPSAAHS